MHEGCACWHPGQSDTLAAGICLCEGKRSINDGNSYQEQQPCVLLGMCKAWHVRLALCGIKYAWQRPSVYETHAPCSSTCRSSRTGISHCIFNVQLKNAAAEARKEGKRDMRSSHLPRIMEEYELLKSEIITDDKVLTKVKLLSSDPDLQRFLGALPISAATGNAPEQAAPNSTDE